MLLSNLLLLPLFISKVALAHPPSLPSTCPIGKICPWSWGQIYTIYENQPNLTVERQYNNGILFEISQKVDDHNDNCEDKNKSPKPYDRIFTLMHLQFSGLGGNGCSLDFNIPCNSSVPFYRHGPAVVAARSFSWPGVSPTWNNIVNTNSTVIGNEVLGTFSEFRRDTFEVINPEVCGNGLTGDLAFVLSIDEGVKESASVKWNQTLMNADIVVGVYTNFTC